eukprot:CAMPEP_0170456136 /NCGR_PEP_ID=MMETSP0123-20130129/3872_1 /TAXON_ID=182087 /ORGANISM="Favella ehrenbergii, Strain Fehren 1" /LENGTH=41 /DNA_ID= /DNA_START= /DNA_END= /DNA_ORIENTATION=
MSDGTQSPEFTVKNTAWRATHEIVVPSGVKIAAIRALARED